MVLPRVYHVPGESQGSKPVDLSSYRINKQQTTTATVIKPLTTTATATVDRDLSTTATETTATVQLTVVEQNLLFEDLRSLVNKRFKAWYCQHFKRLGRERVLRLAALARADAKQDAARYFSWMLKNSELVP